MSTTTVTPAKAKHYRVLLHAYTTVLVVNASSPKNAYEQALRAADAGDFNTIEYDPTSGYDIDEIPSDQLEELEESCDVVSDDPDFDWPQKPETD